MHASIQVAIIYSVLLMIAQTSVAGDVAGLTSFKANTPARAAEVNGNFASIKTAVDDNHGRIAMLEAMNAELQNRLTALEAKLASVSLATVNGQPTVRFSGVNVQVVNGLDHTDSSNGLGNLLIGYDEVNNSGRMMCSLGTDPNTISPVTNEMECTTAGGVWADSHKGGSHYLVLGALNNYSRWGGLVAGTENTSNFDFASISGGRQNNASGPGASVSGGFGNIALGKLTSISGGASNVASGATASVSGGKNNVASGSTSSVTGGSVNTARGMHSSISGGWNNNANGDFASVTAGRQNFATNAYASVTGGQGNTASGASASVTGGLNNTAVGNNATISGGARNNASGAYAHVTGGEFNAASGQYAIVNGGYANNASGQYSGVGGGQGCDSGTGVIAIWAVGIQGGSGCSPTLGN